MSIITPESNTKVDAYEKPMHGFYGQFQTTYSYALSFFQTSVKIEDIDLLKTAGEALESKHFKELVQRDIDEERVDKIVENYLKKKNMVLFFPPLIVSVVAHDNNEPVPTFEKQKNTPEDGGIVSEWGQRFKVSMPTSTDDTNHKYLGKNSIPHWATFSINKKKVHLVVIDGQHRLSALRKLKKNKPEACIDLDIPVCIVFSPNAVVGNEANETITTDVREMFVRINNEGKKVSGHFITLLKDGDITAIAIRQFCEYAKSQNLKNAATLLNLVEWNEREDKRASQITKSYSLTSVGILQQVLSDYGFHPKKGVPTSLLHLQSKETELTAKVPYLEIGDINSTNEIPSTQVEILEQLVDEHIAEALFILFTEPKPYKNIILAFEKSLDNLNKSVDDGTTGAESFRKTLVEFREITKNDISEVRDVKNIFLQKIQENLGRESTSKLSVFQTSVFQQGYIRVWIDMCTKLNRFEVDNTTTAKLLVEASQESTFDEATDLFGVDKNYNNLILYKNQKIQQTNVAKDAWKNLIFASLLNPNSQRVLKKCLQEYFKDDNKVEESIEMLNTELFNPDFKEFGSKRKSANRDYFEKNWGSMEETIDKETFEKLEVLNSKSDDESKTELSDQLEKLADKRFADIFNKFRSVIGIK